MRSPASVAFRFEMGTDDPRAGPTPPGRSARPDPPSPHRLSSLDGPHGSGHPDPDFRTTASAQPAALQPLPQAQEPPLPRRPRQQPIDQTATAADDLARHL